MNRFFKTFFIFLLGICAIIFSANGQEERLSVNVIITDNDSVKLLKLAKLKNRYNNEYEAQQALQQVLFDIYSQGYLTASFDSFYEHNQVLNAWLEAGERYEWLQLSPGNVDKSILSEAGFKEKFYSGKPFNYNEVSRLLNKILVYSENNGFPFAVVRLDSIQIDNETVSASLLLEKNQAITFDTLAIEGNAKISKYFLYNYLGFKAGSLYNENTVQRMSRRLRQLSFIAEDKPVQILFAGDKARPVLNLSNRRASNFDFLVGFLPNNEVTGKLLITGEANLNLMNPFGYGENLRLNWRKLQERTQNLDAGFSFPYIVSLPLGVDAGIRLYKRDTLFLDVDWDAGISYMFAGGNYIKAFVNNEFTNVLNVDTARILVNRRLPDYIDTRKILYGLEYYYDRLNYRFNPTDGFLLRLSGAAGTRRITTNNTITELTDPENPDQTFAFLYDSLKVKTAQYKIDYQFDKYWPLGKRSTIKTAMRGGAIISDNVFLNEMYRLGGTKLLRGFDEESIFSSLFNVATLEFRFLLAQNSYFNVFADGAYTEANFFDGKVRDFPYGFGAGLAFQTKAGMFSISYALGGRQDIPVNFRAAKIHFGYVNMF